MYLANKSYRSVEITTLEGQRVLFAPFEAAKLQDNQENVDFYSKYRSMDMMLLGDEDLEANGCHDAFPIQVTNAVPTVVPKEIVDEDLKAKAKLEAEAKAKIEADAKAKADADVKVKTDAEKDAKVK